MKWREKELPEMPVVRIGSINDFIHFSCVQFPLDYGGYSLDRIAAHQRPLWPEGIGREQMSQFRVDFPMPAANWEEDGGGPDVANANDQNEKSTSSVTDHDHPTTTMATTDAPMTTTVTQTSVITTTRASSSMSAEQSADGEESEDEDVKGQDKRTSSKHVRRRINENYNLHTYKSVFCSLEGQKLMAPNLAICKVAWTLCARTLTSQCQMRYNEQKIF
jgi:hypothetical protein